MTDYRGRIVEIKDPKSPHYGKTGVVIELLEGYFSVDLPGVIAMFDRRDIRIKRLTEDEYNVKLVKDQDTEYKDIDAEDPGMAANVAADGEDFDRMEVAPDSKKGLPKGIRTKAMTKPETTVRTTLEALRYPYTIALPLTEASVLEKKTKDIYGLSAKERYGRLYVTVENSSAMHHLYIKLNTKRQSRTTKAILEGIRRSAR